MFTKPQDPLYSPSFLAHFPQISSALPREFSRWATPDTAFDPLQLVPPLVFFVPGHALPLPPNCVLPRPPAPQEAMQQQLQQALRQGGQWAGADEQLRAMKAELALREEEFEKKRDAWLWAKVWGGGASSRLSHWRAFARSLRRSCFCFPLAKTWSGGKSTGVRVLKLMQRSIRQVTFLFRSKFRPQLRSKFCHFRPKNIS